ncbi:uncharacterized protein B0I36DRAFT_321402 [Microdochium trichocladiopsis]|uniref:Uncharacterized protein n=1 Tax=Microdochium trichocladiopsis TaxID=1682393 RepID=A0A9P9BRY6_9PEZI|nr:uncharacterized protein B0I36DRAFT_321402 [Microdochium trichocladiopsis]KAH7033431.1 hypothetical protein B0I36DRAFT_321402 [Microdochium trichocladiopsis]
MAESGRARACGRSKPQSTQVASVAVAGRKTTRDELQDKTGSSLRTLSFKPQCSQRTDQLAMVATCIAWV